MERRGGSATMRILNYLKEKIQLLLIKLALPRFSEVDVRADVHDETRGALIVLQRVREVHPDQPRVHGTRRRDADARAHIRAKIGPVRRSSFVPDRARIDKISPAEVHKMQP